MNIDDLDELHYITHIENFGSILAFGILSNQRAAKLAHKSVAMQEIQERRTTVRVPTPQGSRPLHSYVNLYITARNPMLSKLRDQHMNLCVVRVKKQVLSLPGVVVTDCNASSGYARFGAGLDGLAMINKDLVFARYWTDADPIAYYRKKSAKCAEVLVPDQVALNFLFGGYVSIIENVEHIRRACELPEHFDLVVKPDLFFG